MATSSASLGDSPINALPAEALSLIFAVVVDSEEGTELPPCVTLTHVCQYWREVALNCSMLWAKLDFSSVKCVQEMLVRSKEAPLKISATLEDPWRQPTVPINAIHIALQHLPRIKEIELAHNAHGLNGLIQTMSSPAPLLERLSLRATSGRASDSEYLTDSTFAGVAPRLRFLGLTQCSLLKWDLPIFQNLIEFELYDVSSTRKPDIAGYLAMLQNMPKLEQLLLGNALPTVRHTLVSEDQLTLSASRPITSIPHLSRLKIVALEQFKNNVWDIAYILSHLRLPALRHLHITCGASEGYLFELHALLPILAQYCHGPQDSAPIQSLAIVDLKWMGTSDNNFVGVVGWTESEPSNHHGALLPQVLDDPESENDSARIWFGFESVDSVDRDNPIRCLLGILSTFPLSNVTSLAVDHTIDDLDHASWWIENHIHLPSINRLYINGSSFRTFCYAFVTNKTVPAMNYDKGTPLAVHRFLKHPERRTEFFDIPCTPEELVFAKLRFLSIVDAGFEMRVFADLFIEELVARKELGAGVQSIELTRCVVDRAYVERLREVVPEVLWDEKEKNMNDERKYRWMDVGSDGGEGSEGGSEDESGDDGSDEEDGSENGSGDENSD